MSHTAPKKMDWMRSVGRIVIQFHSLLLWMKSNSLSFAWIEILRAYETPTLNNENISLTKAGLCIWLTHIQSVHFFIWDWTSSSISIDATIKPKKRITQSLNQFVFRAEQFNHNDLQLISILGTDPFRNTIDDTVIFFFFYSIAINRYLNCKRSTYTFQRINILCFVILYNSNVMDDAHIIQYTIKTKKKHNLRCFFTALN